MPKAAIDANRPALSLSQGDAYRRRMTRVPPITRRLPMLKVKIVTAPRTGRFRNCRSVVRASRRGACMLAPCRQFHPTPPTRSLLGRSLVDRTYATQACSAGSEAGQRIRPSRVPAGDFASSQRGAGWWSVSRG